MHGMRRGSMVLVTWRDAAGGNSWQTEKQFMRGLFRRTKVKTLGRLVRITNEYLITASAITKDGLLQRPGFIPMSLVLGIDRIDLVKRKKKKK